MGNKPHLTGRQKKKKRVESAGMIFGSGFPEAHPEMRICVQMIFFCFKCYQEKLVKEWEGQERKLREHVISENM